MEYITQGIILQSRNLKEEDRIYHIFTLERGLVKAIGKSVCSPKSKLSGFLIPGNLCVFMLAYGKAMDKIAQVKVLKNYSASFNNYKDFILFNQITEILLGFLQEQNRELDIYQNAICFLDDLVLTNDVSTKQKLQLIYFFDLLKESGFMPKDFFGLEKYSELINSLLENSYLKNRELMIKLDMKDIDILNIKNWLKNYFQSILEKKLNSF